ncbi:rhodanese-like domain-containing protein [Aequorivita xiaoshiensis]|uniref:Rhodanese-like domain-containing protein n=1 Tax=Aequorivita xiaoshiensis TaxID=2874476 RepID=A0A9X1R5M6_9FLAO|nr:rhodanese-like domain-containing protein [Aequorivita xiaoshiensis]MCG2431469.1 rhodanese-like domain-containing protein [Aequorivita xiaoshiensis]
MKQLSTSASLCIKSYIIVIFLFGFSVASGQTQKSLDILLQQNNSGSIPYISVAELQILLIENSVVVLDTREANEFNVSHIASAKNIGFDKFSSEDKFLQNLDRETPIVVYCSVGIRSERIGEKLKVVGFSNVKNLYGGIFEWKNKGYMVLDSNGKETENIHTFSRRWSHYLKAGNPVY